MNINLLFLLHLEVWNKFAQFLFLQNKIVKIEESYNNSFHTKFIKYQYKNGKYSIFLSMLCTWFKTTLVNIRTSVSETISTLNKLAQFLFQQNKIVNIRVCLFIPYKIHKALNMLCTWFNTILVNIRTLLNNFNVLSQYHTLMRALSIL